MTKYFEHLLKNWAVSFHALTDFFAHFIHGVFPFIKIRHHQPAKASTERPRGAWYEHIDKGVLKARHGDYVLYKVDYLLDNLVREVNIMESARRMKGGTES